MIVHNNGEYSIQYIGKAPVPASVIVNGKEVSTGGVRGYTFALLKNDTAIKTYTTSEPAAETINSVIEVFKKYMV